MADTHILDPNVAALKAKGNELFRLKQYDEAAKEYSKILDQFRTNLSEDFNKTILCNRAICNLELGRYDQSKTDLNAILNDKEHTPASIIPKAHFRLARCHFSLGAYNEAKVQIEHCEKSLGTPTNQLPPSVLGLKKSIIDKIAEQTAGPSTSTKKFPDTNSAQDLRLMTYEAKVLGTPTDPFVMPDYVPASLCVPNPPEGTLPMYMASIIRKYYDKILHSQPWLCWKCYLPAHGLLNTPLSHLDQDPPKIRDIVLPVCVMDGECYTEATAMMEELVVQAKAWK